MTLPRDAGSWARPLLAVAASVFTITACAGPADDSAVLADLQTPNRAEVVVTTSIWADVVRNLSCNALATVTLLIPPGGDPHAYEPSLAARAVLDSADLVVANGLGLEETLDDVLETVEAESTPVFRIGEHVDTLRNSPSEDHDNSPSGDHDNDDQDDARERVDPHVWFDPVRVSAALPALASALVAEAGLDPARVDTCLTAYQDQLEAAQADITETLSVIPQARRQLVTNHDAFGYFADRYGFEIIGSVIPSPSTLATTSAGQLEALAELIESEDVPAIFAEALYSTDDADALAGRVGNIEVITLYTGSLGDDSDHAGTYLELLKTNARLIAGALS